MIRKEKLEQKQQTFLVKVAFTTFLIINLLFFGWTTAFAQTDQIQALGFNNAPNHRITSSVHLDNGDIIIVGWAWRPTTGRDALIARLNSDGRPIWARVLQTNLDDVFNDVSVLVDGTIAAVGTTHGGGLGLTDILVARFSKTGEILWQRVLGSATGDDGMAITGTPDGRIAVAGLTEAWSAGWQDILVVQMDFNGEVILAKTYGSAMPEEVYDIIPSVKRNGYVLVGATLATRGGIDGVIMEVDYNGQVHWQRRFGGNGIERLFRIIPYFDGEQGYVIAGYSSVHNQGYGDFLLLHITADGKTIDWARRFGTPQWDFAMDVRATPDMGFIVVGYTRSSDNGDDGMVLKTDWQGNPEVALRFSSSYNESFTSVQLGSFGSFVAFGKSPVTLNAEKIIMARWNFRQIPTTEFCAFNITPENLTVSDAPDNAYRWSMVTFTVSDLQAQTGHLTLETIPFDIQLTCSANQGKIQIQPPPVIETRVQPSTRSHVRGTNVQTPPTSLNPSLQKNR